MGLEGLWFACVFKIFQGFRSLGSDMTWLSHSRLGAWHTFGQRLIMGSEGFGTCWLLASETELQELRISMRPTESPQVLFAEPAIWQLAAIGEVPTLPLLVLG